MYITITAQKVDGNYAQSASDFVDYLEKENEGKPLEKTELFFNQHGEEITAKEVIEQIDGNTAKLKKTEPKFYSITINPSKRELAHIQDSPQALKAYVRETMREYAKSFNRDIDGRPVTVEDIKYFAKLETQRSYTERDREIKGNQSYATKILELRHEQRKIQRGEQKGSIKRLQRQISRVERKAPHQLYGKRIVQGMPKPGSQSHVHIIVSRKDSSNRYSLSPGSQYKKSEVEMNGKTVKRGFDRDQFFNNSEKTLDRMFGYKRNYVETYGARNLMAKRPDRFFASIMGLPTREREAALKLLARAGIKVPVPTLPTSKVQLTMKALKKLKRGIGKAMESGSIGI